MISQLEDNFPRLQGSGYRITSPAERRYNCIAWASRDMSDWWWPDLLGTAHWPLEVPRAVTLEAFQLAFATLGYVVCQDAEHEPGLEKIALYATSDGIPTHAARQLPNGGWTSKLGRMEDIEHGLHDLEGTAYGAVALVMKRAASSA